MSRSIYVNFATVDYQGQNTLSSYALPQTPFVFVPYLSSNETQVSTKRVMWDFGDGTTSADVSATHNYDWPGVYKVSLIVYDVNGDAYLSTYTPSVSVIDFLQNQLTVDTNNSIALDIPAGYFAPFIINRSNSWQTYSTLSAVGYSVSLYVSGSQDPLVDVNAYYHSGWSHLLQQSYFLKKQVAGNTFEYVPVSSITTTTDKVYANINSQNQLYLTSPSDSGSFFVGTTGTATAYFTSNKPKNYGSEDPVIIFCNLDSKGLEDSYTKKIQYYNYNSPGLGYLNTAPAVLYAKIRYNPATNISFSTNGIDSQGDALLSTFALPQISWQNTVIPFVAKLEDSNGFSTLFYPLLSTQNASFRVSLLSGANPNSKVNAQFYSEFLPSLPSDVGGYFKGYFICPSTVAQATLSATVTVTDPAYYKLSTINSIWATNSGTQGLAIQNLISSQGNTISEKYQATPYFFNPANYRSFAIAPSASYGYKQHAIWAIDNDNAYVLDYFGNVLNKIDLCALTHNTNSVSANSIALDSHSNAWITLTNAGSTIKIDSQGNLLSYTRSLSTVNANNIGQWDVWDFTLALQAYYPNFYSPVYCETDQKDYLYVSYMNPDFPFIVKFDPDGNFLDLYLFDINAIPEKIICDRKGRIYVVSLNMGAGTGGFLLNGNPQSMFGSYSLAPFNDVNNASIYVFDSVSNHGNGLAVVNLYYIFANVAGLSLDTNGKVWLATGPNYVNVLNEQAGSFDPIQIGGFDIATFNVCLQNLDIDSYNNLRVLNTYDNILYTFDIDNNNVYSSVTVPPSTYNNVTDDCNGIRWINKYAYQSAATRTLSGVSTPFVINPDTGVYAIAKQNENFDMAAYFNSLKMPEYLVGNNVLFKEFLGSIFGSVSSEPYELGKTLYEKIANFGDNTSNIDTATVDAVVSMSQQTGTPLANVIYDYPAQMRRLVDILSIKHSKLYGSVNQYNQSFSSSIGLVASNLGRALNLNTDTFSLSETLVAYEKFSNQFRTIQLPASGTAPGYSQLSFKNYTINWGFPLVAPAVVSGTDIGNYYDFFRYTNSISGDIVDSVINWKDDLVTLNPTVSSYQSWSVQDGIMDNMLNYEMTKGLRLFTSGVNIVYNN